MIQTIILRRDKPADREKAARFLAKLPLNKPWRLEVSEYKPRRSDAQNRFLWSTYQRIIDMGGEDMRGWTKDDLHSFFLENHFGAETITGPRGMETTRPMRTSSRLSKIEFMDFVASIQQFMAERGVYLADPDEDAE